MEQSYYFVFQNESFKIEKPTLQCVAEFFNKGLIDEEITEAILEIPSRLSPLGAGLPFEQVYEAVDVLKRKYSNEYIEVYESGCESPIATYSLADVYIEIFNGREYVSDGAYYDAIHLSSDMMRVFLAEGSWHYGLRDEYGCVITDSRLWPQGKRTVGGRIEWTRNGKFLKPVVWFGLDGEQPISYWSLEDKAGKLFEQWHESWFCGEEYAIRWHMLWNDPQWIAYYWRDEFDIEMPDEEIDNVRDCCPVKLQEEDTNESMVRKVEEYCYRMQYEIDGWGRNE